MFGHPVILLLSAWMWFSINLHSAVALPFPPGPPKDGTLPGFLTIHGTDSTPTPAAGTTADPGERQGFHSELKENMVLDSTTDIVTLQNFQNPPTREGLFVTEHSGFDHTTGVYSPPKERVYFLSAHVHLSKSEENTVDPVIPAVTVEFCLNNDCSIVGSLKATKGVVTSEQTISVVGALWLKPNQHVSVRITSTATSQLTILRDSSFMVFPLSN